MVRRANIVHLPMCGGRINARNTRGMKGLGMGSVLLTGGNGGAGGASSYDSVDDYINTTHRNPYTQQRVGLGRGLADFSKRLGSLNIKSTKKPKNINFTL